MKVLTELSIVTAVIFAQVVVAQEVVKLPEKIHKKTKYLNQESLLYGPRGVDVSEKAPLLVFLHGRAKRGRNIEELEGVGKWMLFKNVDKHELLLVMPQCLKDKKEKGWWHVGDLNLPLEHLKKSYNIDEDRIYLAGYRMGGFGTWVWAISEPRTCAAIAPIAGGGDPGKAKAIKHLPIWVYHGKKDKRVPQKQSEEIMEALKKKGVKK